MFGNKQRLSINEFVRSEITRLGTLLSQDISQQLLEKNDKNQTLVDVIVLHAGSVDISLVIDFLDKFTIAVDDIKKLVYAPALKSRALAHLSGLSNSIEHLELLNRCVVQDTSLGAFFWEHSGFLYQCGFYKQEQNALLNVPNTIMCINRLIVNMAQHFESGILVAP